MKTTALIYDPATGRAIGSRISSASLGEHEIACSPQQAARWMEWIVQDGELLAALPTFSFAAAKEECRRRIYAVASASAQLNLSAAAAAGLLAPDDLSTYRALLGWIADMQGVARSVIAAADASFRDDARWPSAPSGAAQLVARY